MSNDLETNYLIIPEKLDHWTIRFQKTKNPSPYNSCRRSIRSGPCFILGYCFCKDNPEKEVDARPQVFRIVQDLCPRGEINRYGEKNLDWGMMNVEFHLHRSLSPGVCATMVRRR